MITDVIMHVVHVIDCDITQLGEVPDEGQDIDVATCSDSQQEMTPEVQPLFEPEFYMTVYIYCIVD